MSGTCAVLDTLIPCSRAHLVALVVLGYTQWADEVTMGHKSPMLLEDHLVSSAGPCHGTDAPGRSAGVA